MKLQAIGLSGIIGLLFLHSSVLADEILINRSTLLSQPCFACHGPQGNSQGPGIPSINTLSSAQIQQMLLEFKANTRPATLMDRIAKGYSDADLQLIADYIAKPAH